MDTAPDETSQEPLPEKETAQPVGARVATTPPAEYPQTPEQPEKRLSRFFRRLLVMLVGALFFFMVGVLVTYQLLYMPALNQVKQTQLDRDQARQERDSATQQIAALQSQVNSYASVEQQNKSLQQDLQSEQMHVSILKSLSDVLSAQLALAKSDPAQARVVLSKTGDRLKTLQGLMAADQQKYVTDMQSDLAKVLAEIDQNSAYAQADLGVLATRLIQLENSYFTVP